jgi:Ran GTPase-activating protein (RanGAP) involved in mRNA processing and transport
MTTEPTPVRCPAIEHPDLPLVDPAALDPLIARLAGPAVVASAETFPVGTLQPDGRVDLCKQGLGVAGVRRVLPAAVGSSHARHLLLGTDALGNAGVEVLAETLRPGHGLATIYLGCNRIEPDGARALAGRLATDEEVRAVWLKRNPIGDAGTRAVADMLRSNTTIRTLDLVNTGVTETGLRVLLDVLVSRPRPLERLFLGGNGLGGDSAGVLAALIRDAGVRGLYLAANHLGDRGAAALAAAADSARPVRLGLGGNGIGPDGARALAEALDGIESLDLGRPPSERSLGAPPNVIGDTGVATLAAALPGSRLRRLELRHTGITGRGAKTLLTAVADGTRLEYVGLGPGVPRRIKRAMVPHLRPAEAPHPDLHAIGSVYR